MVLATAITLASMSCTTPSSVIETGYLRSLGSSSSDAIVYLTPPLIRFMVLARSFTATLKPAVATVTATPTSDSIKSMAVAGRRAARHASFTSSGNPNEVAVSLPVPARMMPSTVDEPASAFAA